MSWVKRLFLSETLKNYIIKKCFVVNFYIVKMQLLKVSRI